MEIKNYKLNGEDVWQGNISKIDGIRLEKPVHCLVRPLNVHDAEQMGALSEKIYENLRDGEECFIHKHSKEYFYNIFQNPNIRYIGVFAGSSLIGMSYLKVCENASDLAEELPGSNYDFFAKERNGGNTKVASFGADSVLPAYRGNALNALMINYRIAQAQKLGCTDCTSIVDRRNRWNMSPYFASRFNLFATAIDPSDGGSISLLHKPVAKESVLSCFRQKISIPFNRLELIDGLMKKGFIGIDFDKTSAEILFAHSSYYTNRQRENKNVLLLTMIEKKRRIS